MAAQLAKHGTQAGYKAEIARGNACPRCRNAHRVYNKQFTSGGKKAGLKYGVHDVIDHLYQVPGVSNLRPAQGQGRVNQGIAPDSPPEDSPEAPEAPSLGQRLGALLGQVRTPDDGSAESYVPQEESHSYIREIDPDPDPQGDDWQAAEGEEFTVNAAGMKKIEENLGFYLVTVGMTLEMIDPYCGSIAAANANNMIDRWSKVIACYPKAANFFMGEKSGTLFTWINALQATWPLLYATYEHHLARTVQVRGGIAYRKVKDSDQAVPDPTIPPMPDEYQYTTR